MEEDAIESISLDTVDEVHWLMNSVGGGFIRDAKFACSQ